MVCDHSLLFQALVPSGSDTLFSYGHKTVNVPLPQSMAPLAEVRNSSCLVLCHSIYYLLGTCPASFSPTACLKQPEYEAIYKLQSYFTVLCFLRFLGAPVPSQNMKLEVTVLLYSAVFLEVFGRSSS